MKNEKLRLENIIQNMGDAFVSLDREWRYTFVNNKALGLMAKPKEALIGNIIWEVFPDIKGTIFDTEYHKVMDEGEIAEFEIHYPSYNMWLEVRSYPHEDGIAIFYTDITPRKNAEEELRLFNQRLELKVKERTNELEVANKELEAFCYSVSHDLRAPLRAIHGYMNILSTDHAPKIDEEGKKLAAKVMRNSLRMSQLIDDLLDFSKLSRREVLKTNIAMTELVRQVWDEMSKDHSHRDLNIKVNDLPDAYADFNSLIQVWTNLLSNALKYSRHKSKTEIEIGSAIKGNDLIYYIKDNGAGFDMRYYDKLFGVFQRLHSNEEFEGTGVGLAIVQRIIARHGGSIWAEAKLNEGATFYFSLTKNI